MAAPAAPFAVAAGEGTALRTPTASTVTIKAATGQTNGSMTVLELAILPGDGPGLHTHVREDELWWVLDGEFRFRLGDDVVSESRGGMAFGARGVPHTFQNVGEGEGRLLVVTTPSGLERFFQQYAEHSGPVDPAMLHALGEAHGVEFVGPPLSVSDPGGTVLSEGRPR
ncbi:cupin domain-containing protein [Actinomycetospora sp. TBRC 11914]|uniref:cupin domain-containing protein n=1 Tax=Actinomycetospora sp. TBRC 11914 TaxID=2729387 RepID=UPI00145CFBE0|nr:cupin domain-containing protein [Actinomycetospora sp. TBRC 11914]NMO92312.1 cupin domain-containing protein [Actinomycetospora sp. TBRC 11914]